MTDHTEAARAAVLARLAQSREELRIVFEPPPNQSGADGGTGARHGGFPRIKMDKKKKKQNKKEKDKTSNSYHTYINDKWG